MYMAESESTVVDNEGEEESLETESNVVNEMENVVLTYLQSVENLEM